MKYLHYMNELLNDDLKEKTIYTRINIITVYNLFEGQ